MAREPSRKPCTWTQCSSSAPSLQILYRDAFTRYGLDALVFPTTPLPARPIGQDATVELNGEQVPTLFTYIRHTDPGSNAGIRASSSPPGSRGAACRLASNSTVLPAAIWRCSPSASPSSRSSASCQRPHCERALPDVRPRPRRGLVQGVTPGWANVYDWFLPDQYIEVTGVPDGVYLLETIADPDSTILEAEESNNCGAVYVRLANTASSSPAAALLGPGPTC